MISVGPRGGREGERKKKTHARAAPLLPARRLGGRCGHLSLSLSLPHADTHLSRTLVALCASSKEDTLSGKAQKATSLASAALSAPAGCTNSSSWPSSGWKWAAATAQHQASAMMRGVGARVRPSPGPPPTFFFVKMRATTVANGSPSPPAPRPSQTLIQRPTPRPAAAVCIATPGHE